jgi:hypothetical protein
MLGRATLLIAALLAVSAAAGAGSASAAWTKVATWEMNEPANATVMIDSSGNHRSGQIGNLVETGVVNGNFKGYQFSAAGDKGDPNHLVLVDRNAMNPRTDQFKVFLRFKSNELNQNIIQKGQANTAGGNWKIETVDGHVVCSFRGSRGRDATSSRGVVTNGNWHRVLCIRRVTEVVLIVDGGIPRHDPGRTGNIDNEAVLSIGGKRSCNAPNVSCEYFTGLTDRVAISRR